MPLGASLRLSLSHSGRLSIRRFNVNSSAEEQAVVARVRLSLQAEWPIRILKCFEVRIRLRFLEEDFPRALSDLYIRHWDA